MLMLSITKILGTAQNLSSIIKLAKSCPVQLEMVR